MPMAMASSVSVSHFPVNRTFCLSASPIPLHHSPPPSTVVVSFPFTVTAASFPQLRRLCAARTGGYELELGSQSGSSSNLIRTPRWEELNDVPEDEVDWEDLILEETVTLIAFDKMILFSGSYGIGDELSPEHERTIRERLLPYHHNVKLKIGCGIYCIIVFSHPVHKATRCLTIVREDGTMVDFSYWKCVREQIHAETFYKPPPRNVVNQRLKFLNCNVDKFVFADKEKGSKLVFGSS